MLKNGKNEILILLSLYEPRHTDLKSFTELIVNAEYVTCVIFEITHFYTKIVTSH